MPFSYTLALFIIYMLEFDDQYMDETVVKHKVALFHHSILTRVTAA